MLVKVMLSKGVKTNAQKPHGGAVVNTTKTGGVANRIGSVVGDTRDPMKAMETKPKSAEPMKLSTLVSQASKPESPQMTKKDVTREVNVPTEAPFPASVAAEVLRVLTGSVMEKPFTTEMSREFPSRGLYCCVRCRTPIFAAVSKIPIEAGLSGFKQFNVAACEVAVVFGDESSELHVRCKTCKGFIGVLTQDIPQTVNNGCSELVRVNSCCLHFVDQDAASAPVFNNYFKGDDDNGDILTREDFDDIDVIGTTSGASRAVDQKRQLCASWKKAPMPTVSANVRVTASARRRLATDSFNNDTSETTDDSSSSD